MERVDANDIRFINAINRTAHNISTHSGQLFEVDIEGNYKPIGSAVLLQITDVYYICTASHVLKEMNAEHPLYILTAYGMCQVAGKKVTYELNENKIDIGFVQINESVANFLKRTFEFLPIENTKVDPTITENTYLMSFGFPEKSFTPEGLKHKTVANLFLHSLATEKIYRYYKLDSDLFYIVEHAGKGISLSSNNKEDINSEPYGLSGAGLWYLHPFLSSSNNIIIRYFLIGIMTEFRKGKYHVLIANKIKLLLDAVDESNSFRKREEER